MAFSATISINSRYLAEISGNFIVKLEGVWKELKTFVYTLLIKNESNVYC